MLKKLHRLTKAKDFKRLGTQGRSAFGPLMTMRVLRIGEGTPKIGFITSTKAFKRAVDRNRIKRRSREAVRALLSEIPQGIQVIFVLKPEALRSTPEELLNEIRRLIGKVPETLEKPPKLSPRALKEQEKRRKKQQTS